MKTNKKLKLNTKKVVILSDDQQKSVQGGKMREVSYNGSCVNCTKEGNTCHDLCQYY